MNLTLKSFKSNVNDIVKAMGLVFGDIGTSPIYTFTVIFITTQITPENILSILSLILWTLILIVTVQYTVLAMSLSKRGEGGSIVLNEIIKKLVKSSRSVVFFSALTYIGISLLIGDSIITPAISMLSAVEGLKFIQPFSNIPQGAIVAITLVIAISLFSIQKKGTETISKVFGPIMAIWFLALGCFGLFYITKTPMILEAFNPMHGINFLLHHGLAGFFVLSEVILCATGAEALYADMGHLGRKPITKAWCFVLCALVLNYLGQGAFLIHHPHAKNILFEMVLNAHPLLYVPFLLISILATIIASQAMISGLFSVVYQAINTRVLPLFKVNYTSETINSQIYIGAANWFLLLFVIIVILFFQKSENLASAYGLAVTGTMTITAILMTIIFFFRKKYIHAIVSLALLAVDATYFLAACSKIHTGAYWSIIIAMVPLLTIMLYTRGNQALYKAMKFMDRETFLEKYGKLYEFGSKIHGTALFFARGMGQVPPYIAQTMFINHIIYTENIFVHINKTGDAFGVVYELVPYKNGLKTLNINVGYLEVFKLEDILKKLRIQEKAIFYGIEDIQTDNPFWHVFAIIKKVTPAFVSFYNLPTEKIHGVVTKVEVD